jgi:hypothetical protein
LSQPTNRHSPHHSYARELAVRFWQLPAVAIECLVNVLPIVAYAPLTMNWLLTQSTTSPLARGPASRIYAAAVLLVALLGQPGQGDEGQSQDAFVRIARSAQVELQEPAAPPQDLSAVRSIIAIRDDESVVATAAARLQPEQSPAAKIGGQQAYLQTPGLTRPWGLSHSAWEAAAFCHRPLYFEDENLERHGRSFGCFQPAVSAAHFAGRAVAWPYLCGAFPPHECIYTLGRDRPGSCAPYRLYRPPVSVHGALYEAGAIAGVSLVVP